MNTLNIMVCQKINSLDHLKKKSHSEYREFFILLKGGIRSSKRILWDGKAQIFYIENCIDDSKQKLTETEIVDRSYSLIGDAITKGAFFSYAYDITD